MAKICNNIVCGNSHLFINAKDELLCRNMDRVEQIMENCKDFDALWNGDEIHIAASDGKNLLYMRNVSGRWGRGVIGENIDAENIFIFAENQQIKVYYVCGDELYSVGIDTEIRKPSLEDRISLWAMPFVTADNLYYVNGKGMLCQNGREICDGREITHIFANEKWLCFKEKDRLVLAETRTVSNQTSLTRRHGRSAQCPVVVSSGNAEILCWIDGNRVFSAKRTADVWQRLEEKSVENPTTAIYKFCTPQSVEYCPGYVESGRVYRINESPVEVSKPTMPSLVPALPEKEADVKDEFYRQLRTEQLLDEIQHIRKKLLEIDKKIDNLKKIRVPDVITKISKPVNKRNLSKVHKK